MTRTALAGVLDLLNDPRFLAAKTELENVFAAAVDRVSQHPRVTSVRCCGLLAGIEFDGPAPSWQSGFDCGLNLYGRGNLNVLAPPYISTGQRLRDAFDTYSGLLDTLGS